ncbi:MAG: zinc-dependent alcohol dehydrogenase [Christensenellales bacterium]|jgi:L-iditol 2-dehydrogenase
MKALILESYGKTTIREVPTPCPLDNEVLIRVRACAICGSDIHGYAGLTDRRRSPIIMGHEAAGEIEETGCLVTHFCVGDRVVFNSSLFCGTCWYCAHGRQNLCVSSRVYGVHCDNYKLNGAMAEYVVVPERILYRMPDSLDFKKAALVEPLSVALHAVNRTPIGIREPAVVIGSGTIGLMLVQALKCAGCSPIVVLDINDARLVHATKVGADAVINTGHEETAQEIKTLFPIGADHVFEAVGAAETINSTLDIAKRGGTVTLIGNAAPRGNINFQKIVLKELNVIGCYACANEYELAMRLMAEGLVDVNNIISKVAPLEDAQRWLEVLKEGVEDLVKVVLVP